MCKYRMIRERLAGDKRFLLEQAPLADPAVIQLAHDPRYVSRFLDGSLDPQVMRRIGFPWSQGLVTRTLASVGGTLQAAQEALAAGWGGTLAGGTHHAFYAEGSGFCVFNDIAVAIHSLRAQARIRRAAVLDLDVHQGDGTALLFENDPDVLTISLHGKNNFPFRKQRSKIDVELPDGCRDAQFLAELDGVLPYLAAFHPEIVFYQSGVDALDTDRLGRLALSPEGLLARDHRVLSFFASLAVPVVITLGGGYSDPIEGTADAHANTFRTAAALLGVTEPPS